MKIPRFFIGIAGLCLVIGGSIGINNAANYSQPDPLKELFGSSVFSEHTLSANFLTDTISPYNGEISDSLATCIQENSSYGDQRVYAQYKTIDNLKSTRKEIKAEIEEVLGHAVKNKQINWTYDKNIQQYTFYTAPGDEMLWECYFKNETTFFQQFFDTNSITSVKKKAVRLSINSLPLPYATTETIRNQWRFIEQDTSKQLIPLGVLNVERHEEWSNEFFTNRESTFPLLLKKQTVLNSTSELFRNEAIPFLGIVAQSDTESTSNPLAESIIELDLTPMPSSFEGMRHFALSLYINPEKTAHKNQYQIIMNNTLFPSFIGKELGEKEYQSTFLSERGGFVAVYHEGIEQCPIPDLAAPPEGCYWEEGESISLVPGCIIPYYLLVCE